MLEKTLFNKFLKQLESLNYGTINLIDSEGKTYIFQGKTNKEPQANFIIHNPKVITNLVAKGDIGLAESYRDGDFDTNNLENLLIIALKNADILDQYIYGKFFSHITAQILYYFQSNTIKGSQRNIHAHYDLGNAFYALFLDSTMSYSSAIFNNKTDTLQMAQLNKYDRIVTHLEKKSGNLLEIGCGWGGFAERALNHGDYTIKGITISNEQHHFASNRLGHKAQIVLEDYRNQTGKYDNIVSIEMFEAVGEKYWPVYFNKIKSLLSNKGKAIIQTITIQEPYFKRYRKTGDMVRSFIFPGGMLPSITNFNQQVEKSGLRIIDTFKFGQDYATTLKHWLKNFDTNLDKVKSLGFDMPFIRIWRFYLAVCIASFSVGRTNVIQAKICHA
jgi:cyclopropane-fatty-acyl-phospholipid synthase